MSVNREDYPSMYRPGQGNLLLDEVWSIMDMIPENGIDENTRYMMAGMIMGLVKKYEKDSK